jgi:hypothetical protein
MSAHVRDAEATSTVTRDHDLKPPLAHLVLKPEWPRALCGAMVSERFGAGAPGMDRCSNCLRIRRERSLGRPGWIS